VVPLYNEAKGLARLHAQLSDVARKLSEKRDLGVEVVYVDDGSSDDTLKVARALPAAALDVQVLALSRNFGKEAALAAGLDHASRGAVLFMDGDGQHPPALIETLVGHWQEGGYDVVYTAKAHRENESALRRLGSRTFYALLNWGARHKIPEDAGDFRLLSPRAALALRQMPERNRFFKGLASWIGFKQIRVDYEPDQRLHGATTFGWASLLGLSVEGLTSFSVAPLRLASLLGLLLAFTALIFGASMLFEVLVYGVAVPGYPSVVVGLMVLGGMQLVMIGVLGEYIGKILSEQKARPIYFVAEHSVKAAEDEAGSTRTAAE
jgi:glycosyltransferase involved in cell wall biosynthesis